MDTELLKALCDAPGIPGREQQVRALVAKAMKPLVDQLYVDDFGNLIGVKKGKGPKVMLSGHRKEALPGAMFREGGWRRARGLDEEKHPARIEEFYVDIGMPKEQSGVATSKRTKRQQAFNVSADTNLWARIKPFDSRMPLCTILKHETTGDSVSVLHKQGFASITRTSSSKMISPFRHTWRLQRYSAASRWLLLPFRPNRCRYPTLLTTSCVALVPTRFNLRKLMASTNSCQSSVASMLPSARKTVSSS